MRTFFAGWPDPSPRPDRDVVISGVGRSWERSLALRSEDGRYVAVYVPTARWIAVDPGRLTGGRFGVRWFDPRSGTTIDGEPVARDGLARISPPDDAGDWVLTLTAA